jgi:hypothetical protein
MIGGRYPRDGGSRRDGRRTSGLERMGDERENLIAFPARRLHASEPPIRFPGPLLQPRDVL